MGVHNKFRVIYFAYIPISCSYVPSKLQPNTYIIVQYALKCIFEKKNHLYLYIIFQQQNL